MNNTLKLIILMLGILFLCTPAYATSSTTVLDLGDNTTEYAQIGYGSNPNIESLEYWFSQNGITNPDGSAVNPITDQSQAELFYTSETREYEVEFLGIGYASYHSPFGVFAYDGNPYESYDPSKLTFYDPLFVQNEVAINSTYKFTVSAGTYFGFYLNSNGSGTNLTTMVAANPDIASSSKVVNKAEYTNGFDNAIFFATNKGYTIAFEDIIGGGDADWEDMVVNFRPTDGSDFTSSATPEPETLLLLGLGMIGVASLRRRYGKKNSGLKQFVFLLTLGAMSVYSQAIASPVVINYVPAYNWYNGCGPTASGMIMGYWDLHGYDALFSASGWDAVSLTGNVKEELSSSEHNEKYNSTPDNASLPDPADSSLADFFHTSEGVLTYGNSYLSYADDVFIDYAAYSGYQFDAVSEYFSSFSWAEFTEEINAGRPMMLAVDTNQDGRMNHVVTAIGYEDRGTDGLWYASYTTWSENESDIYWQPFRELSSNWNWGIGYATFVKPISIASAYTLPGDTPITPNPVIVPEPDITPDEITPDTPTATPEPASMILLAVGLAAFVCIRKQIHA